MHERKKLLLHRLIWLTITALIIFIPLIINATQPTLELIDDSATKEYYSSLNESSVDIKLVFNRKVESGYATIKYYDKENNLLATDKGYFTAYDTNIAESFLIYIDGDVSSYEIVSYEFEPVFIGGYSYYLLALAIPMLICSLLLSYKECAVDGKVISVYAGFYHHTLRINGELYDEHNTLSSFTPIKLSTQVEEMKIEATISLTNRIAIKINDKICK